MIRAVSHGGGVQTTAMLVLAARDEIPHRLFLFANVGEDSESRKTIDYFHAVAAPYATAHGLELVELRRHVRGEVRTLHEEIDGQPRSLAFPVRMSGGAGFGQRRCTDRFKIAVVARELRRRGATRDDPAEVAVGISKDEIERAHPGVDRHYPWTFKSYPLLDLGISRADCRRIIADAGLPPAPRSACYFCPFHNREDWRRLRREEPDRWDDAVRMDAMVRARGVTLGRGPVGLAHATVPLDQAIDDQLTFDGLGECDSGSCFT